MSVRLMIAAMMFLMVQAVLFGAGMVTVLSTPASEHALTLIPVVTAVSAVIAGFISWRIAVYLRTHPRGLDLVG